MNKPAMLLKRHAKALLILLPVAGFIAGWFSPQPEGTNLPFVYEQVSEPIELEAFAVGDVSDDGIDELVWKRSEVSLLTSELKWTATWAKAIHGRSTTDYEAEGSWIIYPPLDFVGDGRRTFSIPYSMRNGLSVLKVLQPGKSAGDSIWVFRDRGVNGKPYCSNLVPLWCGTLRPSGPHLALVHNFVTRSAYGRGLIAFRGTTLDSAWNYHAALDTCWAVPLPGYISGSGAEVGHYTRQDALQVLLFSYGCDNGYTDPTGRSDAEGWLFLLSDSGWCEQTIRFPPFHAVHHATLDLNRDGYSDIILSSIGVADSGERPVNLAVLYGSADSLAMTDISGFEHAFAWIKSVSTGRDSLLLGFCRDDHLVLLDRELHPVAEFGSPYVRFSEPVLRSASDVSPSDVFVHAKRARDFQDRVMLLSPTLTKLAEFTPPFQIVGDIIPLVDGDRLEHCSIVVQDAMHRIHVRYRCAAAPLYSHYRRVFLASGLGVAGLLLALLAIRLLCAQRYALSPALLRTAMPYVVLNHRGQVEEFSQAMEALFDGAPLVRGEQLAVDGDKGGLPNILAQFQRSAASEQQYRLDSPTLVDVEVRRVEGDRILCTAVDRRAQQAVVLSAQWAQILGMLAHRLKGRLQQLNSLSWRLRGHTDSHGTQTLQDLETQISEISRQAARMSQLSAIRECPLSPVLIERFLRDLVPRLSSVANPPLHAELSWNVPAETRILANVLALTEVVENIVTNAAKSGPPPVKLMIHAETEEFPEGNGSLHRWFILRFVDTGGGITEGELRRLGEPLFSHHEGGTGLGIAIVRQLMAMQEGRFEIASTVGVGTVVTLSFRLAT